MNKPPEDLMEDLRYFLRIDVINMSQAQDKEKIWFPGWNQTYVWPSVHWSDALTTELQSTRVELGHIQGSCMTCILHTDRINNGNYHVCDK